MTPLHGAVPLIQMHNIARDVRQDLECNKMYKSPRI